MLPTTMKALQIKAYDGRLELVDVPVPQPGPGQVLIKIAASPINPSDLKFVEGAYGVKKPLPVVAGFEGSGTVVATGPGLMGKFLMGKRVGCMATATGGGTWAEYMVADARRSIPLKKFVTMEQGAMMVVNPWTAWALLDTARRGGHHAAVHTVASSALGLMFIRLAIRFEYPMIHIVRRQEQYERLMEHEPRIGNLKSQRVLVSAAPDFDETLRRLCTDMGATIALDPIAGPMTGRVLAAMPQGSVALVYGSLSGEPCSVDPAELLYQGKRVEGFWVPKWVEKLSLLGRMKMAMGVQKLLATDLATEVRTRVPLAGVQEAIEAYKHDMTGGKVLVTPGGPLSAQ
jgi:NADPH:quinone reductase